MPTTSAVVIGGSLAGMCAARVLTNFVDTFTIIERDAYPSAHDFRPGVPQACHVHNLLARGLREFEGFFPGFERRMRECGAVAVESGWDVATLWPSGWSQRSHTGLWQLYASRVEPILNPVTGEEHRVRIVLPGFEYKEAEAGKTISFEVKTPRQLAMRHQNTHAQLNDFAWSN